MTRKQVWQYRCDHCGKRSTAAWWVKKHEQRCTANPDRWCGVCHNVLGQEQPSLDAMLKTLPPHLEEPGGDASIDELADYGNLLEAWQKRLSESIPNLSEAAGGCPACMLAALRQGGYHGWLPRKTFDFEALMAEALAAARERDIEEDAIRCHQ